MNNFDDRSKLYFLILAVCGLGLAYIIYLILSRRTR